MHCFKVARSSQFFRPRESQLLHDLAGGCVHELDGEPAQRREDLSLPAVQVAREQFPRRGLPDTCLVISHAHRMSVNDRENRRLAPERAVLLEQLAQSLSGNQPQTMCLWPGLRLVGAGGKVPVALRHAQPLLQREASLRRSEPLHRRGAAFGALRASRESPG